MDIRHAIHPDHLKYPDTASIPKHLLIDDLFENDKFKMVCSHSMRSFQSGIRFVINPTFRLRRIALHRVVTAAYDQYAS